MRHVFVWSEQDGCECDGFLQVDKGLDGQIAEQDGCKCDGFLQVDKGLDGQIAESVVSQAIVCQFLYMVVHDFPMSEKGVTMGRMFLYLVSIEITSYYTCR